MATMLKGITERYFGHVSLHVAVKGSGNVNLFSAITFITFIFTPQNDLRQEGATSIMFLPALEFINQVEATSGGSQSFIN